MQKKPLRGTQTLVGQMGWVFARPSLTAIEVGWRWLFGLPFLLVCLVQAKRILTALPASSTGLDSVDAQNPWIAAVQLAHIGSLYLPPVSAVAGWLLPVAALAWVVVSGVGRALLFTRLDPRLSFRPLPVICLQAVWLAGFTATCWLWLRSLQAMAAATMPAGAEPDLVSYSMGAIFVSLGFFTAWALLSWSLLIAPILALIERRSALSALGRTLHLGRAFTSKLAEINLVMGIVTLALLVLSMVLSAAPLPFSDQLGPEAMHLIGALAVVFYLIAGDYFQVVRLKGFLEFYTMFSASESDRAA